MRLCLLLILLAPLLLSAQSFVVENGQPQAQILIVGDAPRTVHLAAQELQTYVQKITGAELPIRHQPDETIPVRLLIGDSPWTSELGLSSDGLEHGAYRLQSGDGWLAFLGRNDDFQPQGPHRKDKNRAYYPQVLAEWDELTGDTFGNPFLRLHTRWHPELELWDVDKRGSLNAVYGWLRSLGVRWYFPGELGEIVPTQASIPLPEIDQVSRPDFPLRDIAFYHEFAVLPVDLFMWKLRLGVNAGKDLIGLSLPCHGSKFVHTRDEMKEAHPEFYALWNGKRATDHRECGAPCLSSPGLLQKNLSYARHLYDIYDEHMLSVDVCDGYAWLCTCELCEGKGTAERGWNGRLSDYVLGYVNRVATELYKTHPDRMVSGLSYGGYRLPPLEIDQFSPNVALWITQGRSRMDAAAHQEMQDLRQAWMQKLPSGQLYIFEYYNQNWPRSPFAGFPTYFPHNIARDLQSLKGLSWGERLTAYNHLRPEEHSWHDQAVNHLNLYVTLRLLWDADQDVDAMLDEFYRLYYGPAAGQMKAFITYSEANWLEAPGSAEIIQQLLDLLAKARQTAGDSIYGQRIETIVAYTERLKPLQEKLAIGRVNVPEARALRRSAKDITLDGKLDDPFWENVRPYQLKETQTGRWPYAHTTFYPAWGSDDALYIGIRCLEPDMENLAVSTTDDNDTAIWLGDTIDLLLETQLHSYYQITINPVGAIMEIDRHNGFNTLWTADGDVAASRDDDGWTLEIRLPVAGIDARELNPNVGITGSTPTPTFRWYLNVCRKRVRNGNIELSAWSPTNRHNFHNLDKLGEVYVK